MAFTKPTLSSTANYPQQVDRLIDLAEGPARRNFIRNGDFQIAQHGTSFAGITADQYTLDGWVAGVGGTNTVTQQAFTVGQTDVPHNPRNFLRVQRTVAAAADNSVCSHRIEHPDRLAGKTVTVSFYARVGAGTKALVFDFNSSGVTSAVDTSDNAFTATTTWTLVQATINLPAMTAVTTAAYLALRIREAASFGTFTLDIAQVQVEEGSEATRFERLGYDEQLRWALRFLEVIDTNTATIGLPAFLVTTNTARASIHFKVTKRATPTVVATVASINVNHTVGNVAATSVTWHGGAQGGALDVGVAAAPFTAGQGATVGATGTALKFTAEL
jgi:hypothetical protein